MAKIKTAYYCQKCGTQYPQWHGQCKNCGEWNTLVEEIVENNSNKITSVQVFDATGKLVASAKPNSNQFSIENSKFQKGLVIFKISLNGKIETKKFIVK